MVFEERGKLENPQKNLLEQSREPTNSAQPSLGIEPEPHWWKASAPTTAPSLLPSVYHNMKTIKELGPLISFFVFGASDNTPTLVVDSILIKIDLSIKSYVYMYVLCLSVLFSDGSPLMSAGSGMVDFVVSHFNIEYS